MCMSGCKGFTFKNPQVCVCVCVLCVYKHIYTHTVHRYRPKIWGKFLCMMQQLFLSGWAIVIHYFQDVQRIV